METPMVSVIVPSYNHAKFLERRLDSIFNQTYQDFEVILLDDASEDHSLSILKKYSSHPKVSHCIINEKNSGGTFYQWNKGLSLAKAKYVWIAESDDFCEVNFLQLMINYYKVDEELSLIFCQSKRVDISGEVKGNWLWHTSNFKKNIFKDDFIIDGNLFIEEYLIHRNVIPNVSAVLFKRESLEKILPLKVESHLQYIGDWYFYIQLSCNSKVGFISEPLNYFRSHQSSVIALAGNDLNKVDTIEKELEGRKDMIRYLSSNNPGNIKKILLGWEPNKEKLQKKILVNYIKNKEYRKLINFYKDNPNVLKIILKRLMANLSIKFT